MPEDTTEEVIKRIIAKSQLTADLGKGRWEGNTFPSQSEADFSLACSICEETPSHRQQDEIFRLSGLFRNDHKTERALSAARKRVAKNAKRLEKTFSFDPTPTYNTGDGFEIHWAHDLDGSSETIDFVETLLTEGGASVVYGPSNCGKTFWVLSLGGSVATGKPFLDQMEVDQGAVIYVALEGSHGIKNRIRALKEKGLLPEITPLFLCFAPVSLMESADAHKLAESVRKAGSESDLPCRLVILDTLSRAMAGGDENSGKDMSFAVKSIDAIREATGAHVCVIHHCGKEIARGARGHSSLRAAVDTEIELSRPSGSYVSVATVTKQRDLDAREPMAFSLETVVLGNNRRGKPVTSCIVKPETVDILPAKPGRKPKASENDLLALLPVTSTTEWLQKSDTELGIGRTAFYDCLKKIKSSGLIVPYEKNGWEATMQLLDSK